MSKKPKPDLTATSEEKSPAENLSPMMQQYMKVKSENPGTLVMFRLGDFYELFGEDAQIASKELDIVLTGRAAGSVERMPMCGVPHHALEQYLTRLVQKGYRVAICEQLEDPKTVKGIVKRDVVRIVTPGTAMEMAVQQNAANYMAAILRGNETYWGMAVCEVSTGELRIAEFKGKDALSELSAEMLRLKPCEILLSESDYLLLDELTGKWLLDDQKQTALTLRQAGQFSHQNSLLRLAEQFPDMANQRPLWQTYPLAGDCAGAILEYLAETQKTNPIQINSLELDLPNHYLVIDPTTFRNLEVTRNLRTFEKKGSLFDLLDDTRTAAGSRLLRDWVERPLIDKEAIEARYDAVTVLRDAWSLRQDLRQLFKGIYDMERLMTRVVYKRAIPRELLALKQSFEALPKINQVLTALSPCSEIQNILSDLDMLSDLFDLLDRSLVEEIPLNWKEGGFIKAGYHRLADEHRLNAEYGRQWMLDLESREKEKTGIKTLKIGFNKVFGYYFEVTKTHLANVPDYFQRKQTLASGERYVTEELTHLEGQVLGAEEKILSLEMSLYQELLEIIGKALPRVQGTSRALAKLDVFQALAETSVRYHYCRPTLISSGRQDIYFKELRHPVVEQIMEDQRFVPNDLHFNSDTNLLIITGPNMGGKSTYCRSVAIAFIMAQLGSFVPAAEARLPIRDRVFARVGASDDLRGGQSTFMMEMQEVAHIVKYATEDSLVILDEVGRGTGTFDGLSVAWAVSEYLISQLHTKALFATHYLELTQMAQQFANVQNLVLVVEEKGEQIVFLHKILPGSANKSYGIHVARLAGLPEPIIEKATTVLAELEDSKEFRGAGTTVDLVVQERQDQMQLFAEYNQQKNPQKIPEAVIADKAKLNHPILQALLKKNLANMTPIEGLNYLFTIQKQLQE